MLGASLAHHFRFITRMKCHEICGGPQKMIPNDFGDSLTSHLVPSLDQIFYFYITLDYGQLSTASDILFV